MSYNTLAAQVIDTDLGARITAAGMTEATIGSGVDTSFGADLRAGVASVLAVLNWPVCVATQDQYASALAAGIPNPGRDESVITDADILAAVQASWPGADE